MTDEAAKDELLALKKEVSKLRLEANLRKSLATQLEKQKQVADRAKAELEEKHKNLISSLNYASHIQKSIMPSAPVLDSVFPGAFIHWVPQHIVGGDAYFMRRQPGDDGADGATVFCVYDCTGHGVPGAFMTLLGERALDLGVTASGDVASGRAGNILAFADRFIRRQVNTSSGTESNDGMDCFVFDFDAGGLSHYASANFTVFGQTGDGFVELDADPDSVGYRLDAGDSAPSFTTHALDHSAYTALVIISDGILDQKGGPKGLSLGRRRFASMLESVTANHGWDKPVDGAAVVAAVTDYQGENEQRDDMTLVVIPLA